MIRLHSKGIKTYILIIKKAAKLCKSGQAGWHGSAMKKLFIHKTDFLDYNNNPAPTMRA
jgi:hypothetical protein